MTRFQIFQVSHDVFERFPNYIVGCVAAYGIDTSGSQRVSELLEMAEKLARDRYENADLKEEVPFATWREAFSTAGWSPSRFPASVEALHKRIQRGAGVPRINVPVNLANSAVLFYSVPVGTHDMSKFEGNPLEVRLATENDSFVNMAGDAESADTGEIVYAVGNDIRTRRWVWRQGQHALVASQATNIFFPVDGFSDRTLNAVEGAVNFLAEICGNELGATVKSGIVTADNPAFFVDC